MAFGVPGATPDPPVFTGHVDTAGLTALGWDSYDIAWLQAHVWWNEEDDSKWAVTEANLAFGPNGATPITWNNRASYKRNVDLVFFPKLAGNTGTNWSSLFNVWPYLHAIPTHGWNTSNVTNFSSIFSYCPNLRSVGDLSGWVTSKATSIASMFYYCSTLTDIGDVSNWNTSNVTNFATVFYYAQSMRELDLSGWNLAKATSINGMFTGCYCLTSVGDLSNWNLSNTATIGGLFNGCYNLRYIGDVSSWNMTKATSTASMFNSCYSLSHIGDLSNWNVGNVTNMGSMFYGCVRITSIGDLSNWNVSKVTSFSQTFDLCPSLCHIGDLSGWDVSNVTNMSYMFRNTKHVYDIGDLSDWDVSKVTNFSDMFSNCYIRARGCENWNVSGATSVLRFFYRSISMDVIDLSGWDLSSCTSATSVGNSAETMLGYQYTTRRIILGPKFFNGATTKFYFNTCWSWTRDSIYESLYTNQTLRNSSSTAVTVRLYSYVYDTLSPQDISDIATKNITLVRV